MRSRSGATVIALALLGIVPLTAPPAAADFTCTLDEGTGTLTVTFDQQATVKRSGDVILVKGQPCEGATVFNTDLVRFVTGMPNKHQEMKIDLSGGLYVPGMTDEGDGSSEIEFEATTGINNDGTRVIGTPATDHFVRGFDGVNLNPEESVDDVDLAGPGIALLGRGGNDLLSANGGAGTGGPGAGALLGGDGDDTFIAAGGGESANRYEGGPGFDLVDFSHKTCSIEASDPFDLGLRVLASCRAEEFGDAVEGIEELIGTRFDDYISGTETDEVFRAKRGDDRLFGKGGNDLLDGGAGIDLCRGGDGDDVRIRCE